MVRRSSGKSKISQDRVGRQRAREEAFGVSLRASVRREQILVVVAIRLLENTID
jgi:hypothetical protein